MKRLEANDPVAMVFLGYQYEHGLRGLQQDYAKAKELYTRAADLGCSKAHIFLAELYHEGGNMKKAKFHNEAAAMAGNEVARYNLGIMEKQSGNLERAVKHLTIASSAGCYSSMDNLRIAFEYGVISRESIDSTLAAYNSSCAEMRSEARDDYIRFNLETM